MVTMYIYACILPQGVLACSSYYRDELSGVPPGRPNNIAEVTANLPHLQGPTQEIRNMGRGRAVVKILMCSLHAGMFFVPFL